MTDKKQAQPEITVGQFYAKHAASLQLKLVGGAQGMSRRITEGSVNRVGLALTGFFKYYAYRRVQLIGSSESAYLSSLPLTERRQRIRQIFAHKLPCLVYTRNIKPPVYVLEEAEHYGVPVFTSPFKTTLLVNRVTIVLEEEFAPTITLHSSMVDIQGVGVLIVGESGIGKSECVLGLIERGYSLVSDDATRIRCLEGRELTGTSHDLTRHYIEVRGIGILNVASIFGASSIRYQKRIDLVVTLKEWSKMGEDIDRLGLDQHFYEILQIKIPHVTIPVRMGRDLSGLVEVAALDQKLKSIGHHSAFEFNERLLNKMQQQKER
ncbi:MAG: HPr(Ser) kinase/phosphatase [Verrucomicrobiales bacterium]|jgi:HPr kinase/phosphorylase|nr:HPr(Ser) kinase/phosphatase [Verrucomicrobiales bacterium]